MSASAVFSKVLESTRSFVAQNFSTKHSESWPEHRCPNCGAGLSRLILLGGINHPRLGVKAAVGCRDCGRAHKVRGTGAYERHVFCVARDNVRTPKH